MIISGKRLGFVVWGNEEDGAGGAVEDAFAGAAEEEFAEGAAGAGAHENGIDVEPVGFAQDDVGGGALQEQGGGVDAGGAELGGRGLELVVFDVVLAGEVVADAVGAGFVADEIGVGRGDMDDPKAGGKAVGPEAGFGEDGGGGVGKIQSGEEFHGGPPVGSRL